MVVRFPWMSMTFFTPRSRSPFVNGRSLTATFTDCDPAWAPELLLPVLNKLAPEAACVSVEEEGSARVPAVVPAPAPAPLPGAGAARGVDAMDLGVVEWPLRPGVENGDAAAVLCRRRPPTRDARRRDAMATLGFVRAAMWRCLAWKQAHRNRGLPRMVAT